MSESYGLPRNTAINYGEQGKFPQWVYTLCDRFNLRASTYPGHQANQRPDIGAAPNPQGLNRGIDWVGTADDMLRFAKWLRDTEPSGIEMVIYQHPRTGERVGYPTWVNYSSDYNGHRDHVHTRQSQNLIAGQFEPKLSDQDRYALAIIEEGRRRGVTPRGIHIALATALVESGNPLKMYANAKVPESLNLPHDAVGFDHDSVGLFQQRCPMWGPATVLMNPTLSAGLFYDHLTRLDYNGPDSPGSYAQAVQRSAFPGRYDERFGDAVALYNRLISTQQEDDMAQVPQEQWDRLYRALMEPVPSQSALRMPGEGNVGSVVQLLRNVDGMQHIMLVELLARLGDPAEIDRLHRVAANTDPARARDAVLAATILDRIASGDPQMVTVPGASVPVQTAAPPPAAPPPLVPTAPPPATSPGALLGQAFDALMQLRLNTSLPADIKAPLDALIGVLGSYPQE